MQLPTQARPRKLKIICVTNEKGGCGKSTLSVHIAVTLEKKGYYVGMMDLDPHGSMTKWFNQRESSDPDLLQIPLNQLEGAIPQLDAAGVDFLIIDTPGFEHHDFTAVFELSDVLLVPSKASLLDLWATAEALIELNKVATPKLFVLNEVHPSTNIATDAVIALAQVGKLGPTIHWKAGFLNCIEFGQTIMEISRRDFGGTEIAALTDFVLMNIGVEVPNPVVIDPLTRKLATNKVVKKPSKHGPLKLENQLTEEAPKALTGEVIPFVRDQSAG